MKRDARSVGALPDLMDHKRGTIAPLIPMHLSSARLASAAELTADSPGADIGRPPGPGLAS
jgi:hypothetical protein